MYLRWRLQFHVIKLSQNIFDLFSCIQENALNETICSENEEKSNLMLAEKAEVTQHSEWFS